MLTVEALSPPAVPNACEEPVERQQGRSAAGETAALQRTPAPCKAVAAVTAQPFGGEGPRVGEDGVHAGWGGQRRSLRGERPMRQSSALAGVRAALLPAARDSAEDSAGL